MNKITGVILVLIAASVFMGCESIQDFGVEYFQQLDYDIHSLLSQLFAIMGMGPMSGQIGRFKMLWNMHNKFNTMAENQFKMNFDIAKSIKVKADNKTVKFVSTIYEAIDELAHDVNAPAPFIDPGNDLTGIAAVSQEESLAFISDFTNKFENFTITDIISKILDVRGFKQQIEKSQVKKRRRKVKELKVWQPSEPGNKTRRISKEQYPRYPFVVSIHEKGEFVCSGAILGSLYVLTAASCLHLCYQNKDVLKDSKAVQVRAGSDHSKNGGQLISAETVIFHPQYNPETLTSNLAFVQLKWSLYVKGQSTNVMKILFKNQGEFEDVRHVIMIGWGDKELAKEKDVLTGTRMDIVPILPCSVIYTKKYVTSSNFCGAILKGGVKDTCFRDVGSPAVVGNTLVGLVSYGPSLCGPPSAPTVYSDLGEFSQWITSVLHQEPKPRAAEKQTKSRPITPCLSKLTHSKNTKRPEIKSTTKRQQKKPTTKRQETKVITAKRAIDFTNIVKGYPDAVQLLSFLLKKIVAGSVHAATVANALPGSEVNITVAEDGDKDITLKLSGNKIEKFEVRDVTPATPRTATLIPATPSTATVTPTTPRTTTDKMNEEGSSESEYVDTDSYLAIGDDPNVSEEGKHTSTQENISETNTKPPKQPKENHKNSTHETSHATTTYATTTNGNSEEYRSQEDGKKLQGGKWTPSVDKTERDEIEQIINEVKTKMKLQSAGKMVDVQKETLKNIVEEVLINHEKPENPESKEPHEEYEVSEIDSINKEETHFAEQNFADVPEDHSLGETESDTKEALEIKSSRKKKVKATKSDKELQQLHLKLISVSKKKSVGNKTLQNIQSDHKVMLSKNFKPDTSFAEVGIRKQTTSNYYYLVMKKPEDDLQSFALVNSESQEETTPPKPESLLNFAFSSEILRVLKQGSIMKASADEKLPPITLDLSAKPDEGEERKVDVDLDSDDISMFEKLLETAGTTVDDIKNHLRVAEPWANRRANRPRLKKFLKAPVSIKNQTTGQGLEPQRRNMPRRNMPQRNMPQRNMPQRNMLQRNMPQRNMPQRNMPRRFAAKPLNFDIGNDFRFDIYGRPLPTAPTPRTTRRIELNFELDVPMSNLFAAKPTATKLAQNQFYNFDILQGTQITEVSKISDFSAAPYQNIYQNGFATSPNTPMVPIQSALLNSARYQQIYQDMLNAGLRLPLLQSEKLNDAFRQGYNQNINTVSNTPPTYPPYATQPSTFNYAGNTQSFSMPQVPAANNQIDYGKMMELAFGNMALQQSQSENHNKQEPIMERELNIDTLVKTMTNVDSMAPNMQLQINNPGSMNSVGQNMQLLMNNNAPVDSKGQNMQLLMNNADPISENIQKMRAEPNIEEPEFDAALEYALEKRRVPDGNEKSRHSHTHHGDMDDYNDFKHATLSRKLAMATRTERFTSEQVKMIVGDDYNYDARTKMYQKGGPSLWTNDIPDEIVDDVNI